METPLIDIVRGLPRAPELRADDDADGDDKVMPTLAGHFTVFDAWYEVHSYWEGDFLERIAAGACAETFRAHWDDADPHKIKVQFQHGYDTAVGVRLLGKLNVLREDKTGGYYEAPLFDTSYNADLIPGLEAGEYGASFRFRVSAEAWDDDPGVSDHNPKGLPERTITRMDVFELGPVAFGASPVATAGLRAGGMRCLTDAYYDQLREASPSRWADACRVAEAAGRRPRGYADGGVMPRSVTITLDPTVAGGATVAPTPAPVADTKHEPDGSRSDGAEGEPPASGEAQNPTGRVDAGSTTGGGSGDEPNTGDTPDQASDKQAEANAGGQPAPDNPTADGPDGEPDTEDDQRQGDEPDAGDSSTPEPSALARHRELLLEGVIQ